jgi:hypothetical protein
MAFEGGADRAPTIGRYAPRGVQISHRTASDEPRGRGVEELVGTPQRAAVGQANERGPGTSRRAARFAAPILTAVPEVTRNGLPLRTETAALPLRRDRQSLLKGALVKTGWLRMLA